MKSPRLFMGLCVSILFLVAASPALAQRAFVSAKTGSDGNPCSLASPCRTFGTAIAAVGAGGEIVVLDSGGYGPVTITKSITIKSPAGIYAGITVISGLGDAIDVTARASDIVTLRGLTLNVGQASGRADLRHHRFVLAKVTTRENHAHLLLAPRTVGPSGSARFRIGRLAQRAFVSNALRPEVSARARARRRSPDASMS